MPKKIEIFDTTLRDGEQTPGISLNVKEKLEIARQLEKLSVDVIEAGFPIASNGDFNAVKAIAENVKGPVITGLARANFKDIDRAAEALKAAERPRIHTFIASSPIHMKYKLKMTEEQVLEAAVAAVKRAKSFVEDVEFSAEDASRSDVEFLCRLFSAAIKAGATVINIPDTVGYTTPGEFGQLIKTIIEKVPEIDKVKVSVHCHDDLGMAVANSLEAVIYGATQVECAVNGLGERAGNAALEEIVMALDTRKDFYQVEHGINTKQIYRTSKMVSTITGIFIQPNKAIVGANAFAHESGIHQHGVLTEKSTYEIMTPQSIGLTTNTLVLGKHSGRHAFAERLKEMGYELSQDELNKAFERFKDLADRKKEISDLDIEAIVEDQVMKLPQHIELECFQVSTGNKAIATATVRVNVNGKVIEEASTGDGPIDAIYKALERACNMNCKLVDYSIRSVTAGKDALGEVTVRVEKDGRTFLGRGLSIDIIEASAMAYTNAMNKTMWNNGYSKPREVD
ncbi:2-isopropylmalate synthase [Tepidanaerobacter acetatoxydans Re1]|uniref:2-isopropylmalate synthase n=1 Tax=Tepidanaerobacter acetatoxydans (strain DSM 21804 / JCM 16047 / Re1) TaxID=1209989 RepID=F4LQR5_TEPAE|nr:2-isopropylmalate synthase [Tepidanaerobacter acetatoxydans]AEE92068.1 2-isopropylmalate synthase [Tepidanaerobacter acetatoxydans Re1]CCP26912.1 2-isopropylmalate synthase [Tepidanaerobacter acetatoxydans Re1]